MLLLTTLFSFEHLLKVFIIRQNIEIELNSGAFNHNSIEMDIDKARALELAISFVSDRWKSLSEDDITISVVRYMHEPLYGLHETETEHLIRIPILLAVDTVVDCTVFRMYQNLKIIRPKSS